MSRNLGTVSILELQALAAHIGRAVLPYPFRFTKPVAQSYEHEMREYRNEIRDRVTAGEFAHLRRWLDVALRDAEIRVDSMVTTATDVVAAVSATRWQELGFVAVQDNDDNVTVHQVSAYEIGAEVAKLARLGGKPGVHPRVEIPSVRVHTRRSASIATGTVVVDGVKAADPLPVIPFEKLVAGGRIHVDHRTTAAWSPDRSKEFIAWVNTADGDYVVQPPYEFAKPVTRNELAAGIDRLIAAEAARLREKRTLEDAV
jgi:hypothetical protein